MNLIFKYIFFAVVNKLLYLIHLISFTDFNRIISSYSVYPRRPEVALRRFRRVPCRLPNLLRRDRLLLPDVDPPHRSPELEGSQIASAERILGPQSSPPLWRNRRILLHSSR